MTVLYNYQAAVSEYQELRHEGSLSEWLVANGFATSKLTALILASALKALGIPAAVMNGAAKS